MIARLISLIKSDHNKEKVLFWPHLPSSHYGHDVLQYFNQNEVQFVDKEFNPQARPIESLCSILKNMGDDQGWQAKTIDHLQRRISKKLKEIDIKIVEEMFSGIGKQLTREHI